MKKGMRWQCTRHFSKKCGAYIVVDDDGELVKKNDAHTHDPFKYFNHNGIYMKI
jgi:hypothetical protein